MIIGFTGSRQGMTGYQKEIVKHYIERLTDAQSVTTYIHGMCIGSDKEFHQLVLKHDSSDELYIDGYPGIPKQPRNKSSYRAEFDLEEFDVIHKEEYFLDRNKKIVDNSSIIIATPSDRLSGGTWSTINYAKSIYRPVLIIEPR